MFLYQNCIPLSSNGVHEENRSRSEHFLLPIVIQIHTFTKKNGNEMKTKIGILGSGIVAKTLGNGFLKHGYEVMLGSRDQTKLTEWKSSGGDKAKTGSFEETAKFGEIIVLAVKGNVTADALHLAGKENLKGKTVIDTSNPIAGIPPQDGVLHYFSEINHSLMEKLQDGFPDAHFVKAFNSIGNAYMVNPQFSEGKPSMFICGNKEEAKNEVKLILDQFGFDIEDMGKATAARAIEPLCMLWCIPGMLGNGWDHAFRLMRK